MKPHKSPRVRNKILSSDGLAYQPLEPRRMLAGDVTDIVFSADFEDANVAAGTYGHFANVSGFSATGADVEIQNNFLGVGPASEGSNLLELDGVNGVAVQLNERVDEGLVLKFDYSPRPKVRKALNEVEIWWNGELLNTVERNGRRLRSTDFQSYEVGLPAVESGSATLEFRSNFSRDRKGLGGLIDNVTVLASSTFPGLNDIADQELAVGDSIALTAELETPIEDEVTFSILNGPEGLQIDPSTGEITWVASQNAVDSSNADNNVRGTGTSETAFQSGFEDAGVPAGEYRFFESIDGFESSNAGVGVEIQNNHFSVGRASEGDHHLELDGNNGVFRNVDTSSAANWQLQLDFSPRPGVAEAQNEIELWWDGDRVETISGNGIALSQTAFTRHTFDLPQPSSDSTRLELRSDSPEDRVGLGGLVDNIVLNRAETTQTNGQQNKFQVVVQASNGSQVSTTDFLICIGEPGENRAPTLAAISQQQVDEETELTVQLTASDPDTDDTLTYGIVTGPGGATIDAATGLIRWTPTESDGPGQTSIVARVGDDNGGSDQQTISIQVNEVNRDPVLEPIANRMVAVDGDVSFSVVASDPDLPANELAFSLAGDIPAGASVDIATGDFSWTSVAVAPGQYPMQLVVTDGNGGSASQDFVIDVGGCSFEDSLTAWAVAENGGTASGHGSVVGESCIAILTEGDSFETTLSTTFVVPENSGQLNFVYDQLNFDTTDSAFINDAFEVALVDSEGRSLVDTYTDGRDAFYNITEGLPASLGSQVNVSDTSVVLDTSGILAGEVATLIFRLTNNDSDTDTSVQITQFSVPGFGSGSTLGSAKFYVADPEIDSVFTYDTQGQSQNSFLSASSSQQAHGLTSNADGSRVWSVDRDTGLVSVYGGNGSRLGAWTAAGVTQAEGIATDGTDIWIADVSDNTIHHFTGGSSQLGGSAASSTLLNLNSENSSPAGLTTNGTNLWIVDSGTNSVFVYAISDGSLLGSWQLDSANTDPSGITNDANGGNNLWVVDRSGTVFHYADATTSRDGVLAASDTFELNDRNASPEGIADPPIKFVALTTAFNNPIGIDYHEPSESVVVSVNYSNGQPHNFELIDRDGISERFSSANGFANEVKIATVKSNNPGGFTTGDLFVGNGVDGQIARVTDNGDQFISNWVDLPGTGNGLFRGGLFIDDTEVFGGDLIAVTNVGEVWRVTSSGEPTLIADTAVHLEGVYVVPDELAFGPIAGTIIAGAEQQGLLYSISAEGTVQTFDVGVAIEDIDIVRPGQNFFGVNFGTQTILGASASDFAPYAEGILLTQETHNGSGLFHLLWNGSDFVAEEIQIADGSSSVGQWEHVTFAAAGLAEISDPPPPPTILASVSRNELPAGQSVLIAGEASAFGEVGDGIPNDIVTVFANDLHVEVLDRGGRFFTRFDVHPGLNQFEMEATDLSGQKISTTLEIFGTTRSTIIDQTRFVDVTGSFSGVYGRTSFNQRTERLFVDLATRNDGTFVTDVPLYVGVKNVSDPLVEVLDAAGVTSAGIPYYDFSSFVTGGRLAPNEVTGSPTIQFHNPGRIQFGYELEYYTKLNEAPEIVSLPRIEALAGRRYEYDANAIDRDDDPLSYQLLVGPAGMTIDAATGVILWEPSTTDIGNYSIAIQVDDGRGGQAEQRFTLAVIEPPPNRPPVITSDPVTIATLSNPNIQPVTFSDSEFLDSSWKRVAVRLSETGEFVQTSERQTTDGIDGAFRQMTHDWGSGTSVVVYHLFENEVYVPQTEGGIDSINYSEFQSSTTDGATGRGVVIEQNGSYFVSQVETRLIGPSDWTQWTLDALRPENFVELIADAPGEVTGRQPDFSATAEPIKFGYWRSNTITGSRRVLSTGIDDWTVTVNKVADSYAYDVAATDPDGDSLEYSLSQSPTGMTIDRLLGVVQWNPDADQLGNHDVTVRVEDGRGGIAEQSFIVAVKGDPDNNAPVIVSTPNTSFVPAGVSNPASGLVSPTSINAEAQDLVSEAVSFTFPDDGTEIGTADVIFIVDESASMAGEQAWLGNIIETLDQSLQSAGLTGNRFGLVGFANSGRVLQSGDDAWMDAETFATASDLLSTGRSGDEDGYLGVDFALDNFLFRDQASRVIVLVTDEERTTVDGSLTFESTRQRLEDEEILFSMVANARLEDSDMSQVFGVAPDGVSYSSNGAGQTVVSSGGVYTGSEPVGRGDIANIESEYVDLAWAADGLVWDLNFLREDQAAADTFTEVFVDILGSNIVRNIPINVVASNESISFVNNSGIQTDIAPGETVSFDVEFSGSDAIRFDLVFVNANTNEVLGSIPVNVNDSYQYQVVALDADSDELVYSVVEGPEGLAVDPNTGLVEWDAGANRALAFDGLNDLVWVEDSSSLQPENLTIEGWFNFDVNTGQQLLIDKHLGDSFFDSYALWYDSGTLNGVISDRSGVGPFLTTSFTPETGRWYHFAYTFDDVADAQTLYIDGVQVAEGLIEKSIEYDSDPLLLGASYDFNVPASFFKGQMDEVRIWNTARLEAEIRGQKNFRLSDMSQILAYWSFDELSGIELSDSSSNQNHASLGVNGLGDDLPDRVASTAPIDLARMENVILRVEDGRGGFDEQNFILDVSPNGSGTIRGTKFLDAQTEAESANGPVLLLTPNGLPNSVGPAIEEAGFELIVASLEPGELSSSLAANPDIDQVWIWSDGAAPLRSSTPPIESLRFTNDDLAALSRFQESHREWIMDGLAWRTHVSDSESNLTKNEALAIASNGGGIVLGADDGYDADSSTTSSRITQHVNQVADHFGFELFLGAYSTSPANQFEGGSIFDSPNIVDPAGLTSASQTYAELPHGLQTNGVFLSTVVFGSPSPLFPGEVTPTLGSDTFNGQLFENVNHIVTTSIADGGINRQGLEGWTIYLDQNQNGIRDVGEQFTTTDENGDYEFINLPTDTYFVREENQAGWVQTLPGGLGSDVATGDGFADVVLEYFDGGQGPIAGPQAFGQPVPVEVVLGDEPGITGGNDFVSLTTGSFVTVGFVDETVIDGFGNDIFIKEVGSAFELADIFVSSDGSEFVFLGTANGGATTQFDLASIGYSDPVVAVRVVGLDSRGSSPGFDLLGVEVLPGSIGGGDGLYIVPLGENQVVENRDFGNRQLEDTDNTAPVFVTSPPVETIVGELLRYDASATDLENDTLTYSVVDGPSGLTINPATGTVVWLPTANSLGANDVLLEVRDGRGRSDLQSFTLEVVPYNTAPVVNSTPPTQAVANLPLEYLILAKDSQDDALAFTKATGPTELSVDSTTGLISWTPSDSDVGVTQSIAILIADDRGGETLHEFTLDVVATAPNVAPVIHSMPAEIARLSRVYYYEVQADDSNSDPLTYTLVSGPVGMTIDGNRLSWTPSAAQASSPHSVELTVTDSRGGEATQTFELQVLSQDVNRRPVIVSTPFQVARQDRQYSYDLAAEDADGDPVRWSLLDSPLGMTVDRVVGTVRWTPTVHQVGSNRVTIVAADSLGAETTQIFEIEVTCVNGSPMIHSTPLTAGVVGSVYFYAVRADDPDGDQLSFRFGNPDSIPEGMAIDSNGLIRWNPTESQVGSHDIVIIAEDTENAFATQQYTIVVEPATDDLGNSNSNRAPLISSTPPFTAEVGESYLYAVEASDPEGETLSFEFANADSIPNGLTIDAVSGEINWAPTVAQVGSHVVAIMVKDPSGAVASQAFTIEVRENLPPEILSTPSESITAGAIYRYSVRATDPESGQLSYELTESPAGMSIDPFGRITWQTGAMPSDPVDVMVTVSDDRGKSVSQSWQISQIADTLAPQVSVTALLGDLGFQSGGRVDIGSQTLIRVTATDQVGVESVQLELNGELVPLDGRGQYKFDATQLGEVTFRGIAADAAGNIGEATIKIQVVDPANPNQPVPTDPDLPPHPGFNPTDNGRPIVEITAPEPLTNVSNIVSIVGTVDDPEDNLWYYRALYAKASDVSLTQMDVNDPDWVVFHESTDEVIDGELAVFDPTALNNDAYVVAISAYDVNGQGYIQPTVLFVEGNVLLGNFTLEFTDLSIPLSGIPIQISRVYDTVNADDDGDFGFGWRLGAQDARILEVGGIAPGGAFNPGNNTFAPDLTKVYLTNPDGQRVGFTYKEQLISASFFGGIWRPHFEADPGVYDTLTIDETQVARGGLIGALTQGINPDFYTLTTKDNLSYRYEDSGSLISITDLNGNEVTFSEDGIQHSSGNTIEFVRDHRDRITSIVDPAGNSIQYEYNLAGDLVKFTNQESLDVRYTYRSNPAHYLDEAYDLLDRRTIKVEYDAEDMFVGVLDAEGNRIDNRDYDTDANTAIIRDANGNPTTLLYDDRGNVIEETDADGNVTIREYNDPANPDMETRIVDRVGNVTEREYDSRGNLLKIMELGGPGNQLATPTETSFTYDTGNRVTSISNADDRATTFDYDDSGNLEMIVNADGDISRFSYDNQGRRTSFTDFKGNETTFEYLRGDQPAKVTFADGSYQQFEYNHSGQVTFEGSYESDGTLAQVSRTEYDRSGRSVEEITGEEDSQTIVRRIYDGQLLDWEAIVDPQSLDGSGNLTESPATPVADRKSRITDFDYDSRDRLIAQTDAEGGVVHFRYDTQGNRVALMDPVGNVTSWIYDELNRVVEERDPLYWEDVKSRDAAFSGLSDLEFLNLIAPVSEGDVADPLFDDPSGADIGNNVGADHVSLTAYDAESNVAKEIDRNGRRLEFEYDFAGRLLEENWYAAETGALVNTLQFTYDELGNQLSAVDLKVDADDTERRYVFTYDALNRLITSDNAGTPGVPNFVLTYEYDAQGNVISTTDNFGVTAGSEYDTRNRLSVRTWFDADGSGDVDDARVEFDYNSAGRMTETRHFADRIGDATNRIGKTVRTHDLAGRSGELNHLDSADVNISSYNYDYDFAGLLNGETRVHQLNQFSRNIVYSYDLTGQLTEANYSGQPNETFAYDANGNRESSTAHGASYSTESGNRLTTDGTFSYEYDGEGNLVLKTRLVTDDDGQAGEVTAYEYDHRNRLVNVTIKPSADSPIILDEVSYQYDALGRRIARTENGDTIHFVYNGENVWADFNEVGEGVARYLFGNAIDQNIARWRPGEGTAWYLTDRLGTIRDLIGSNGTLTNHTEFESYGKILTQLNESFADRFGLTGREFDVITNDYYYRARFYNPSLGNFVSNDPLGFGGNDENLQRFVANSPVMFVDPFGTVTMISYSGRAAKAPGEAFAIASIQHHALLRLAPLGIKGLIRSRALTSVSQQALRNAFKRVGLREAHNAHFFSRLVTRGAGRGIHSLDDFLRQLARSSRSIGPNNTTIVTLENGAQVILNRLGQLVTFI